jgi:outer membrane murein-binding lipoprotein Lpp
MSMRTIAVVLGSVVGCALVVGCGVSEQKLDEAKTHLETLTSKGVPDSMLTDAKVLLVNARTAIKTGNTGLATRNADSMFTIISSVEAWYDKKTKEITPDVEKRKTALEARKGKLSGEQLAVADSLLAEVDSLMANNWVLQAQTTLVALDTTFGVLEEDEERMKEVVDAVPGRWAEQAESAGKGLSAVRTKKFTFNKDGTVSFTETMKGRSAPDLKEDWKFQSWGTWKPKGDTVFIHVEREKCVRKNFQNLVNGKWQKNSTPPYDSTFTDGHKDLFMTYTYMEENMKKY